MADYFNGPCRDSPGQKLLTEVVARRCSRNPVKVKALVDVYLDGQYPVHVKSITYTAARENLASTINRVCEDHAPVVITRNRDQAVVMLSLAEYESLQETAYLLRSPANAKRLLAAVDTLKRGKGIKRKIKLGA